MSDSRNENARRREELRALFRDREYREIYAEGFLRTWIPAQLARVRQQRGLTQRALADQVGTKQPGIARMERDDYGKWNLATLARVAAALDCRLKVSLETYGTLLDEVLAFESPEFLERAGFAQDPIFREAGELEWERIEQPGPVGEMRRKWRSWYESGSKKETMVRWLSGAGMPAAGTEEPPSFWLMEGLKGAPAPVMDHAVRRVETLLQQVRDGHAELAAEEVQVELFEFVAAMEKPAIFEDPLLHVRQKWGVGWRESLQRPAGRALARAMRHNQNSARFREDWMQCIEDADPERPGASLAAGFWGLQRIPNAPNAVEVGGGCIRFDRAWTKKREEQAVHEGFRKTILEMASTAMRPDYSNDMVEYCKVRVSEPTLLVLGSAYMTSPSARRHHRTNDSTFMEMEFISRLSRVETAA